MQGAPGDHRRISGPLACAEGVGVRPHWEVWAERIPHYKIGKYLRFKPDEVDKWLERQQSHQYGPALAGEAKQ